MEMVQIPRGFGGKIPRLQYRAFQGDRPDRTIPVPRAVGSAG